MYVLITYDQPKNALTFKTLPIQLNIHIFHEFQQNLITDERHYSRVYSISLVNNLNLKEIIKAFPIPVFQS